MRVVAPTAWDVRLACYGFVGASSYLSASEPYSYNGLRNRVFRQRFAHLHSSERKTSFSGLWRDIAGGSYVGDPCYPARCRTSFNCSCYVLKGCAHNPCRRGDSSCSRRPFDASWLLIYNICCTDVKRVLSEPGFEGFEGWKDSWSWVFGAPL